MKKKVERERKSQKKKYGEEREREIWRRKLRERKQMKYVEERKRERKRERETSPHLTVYSNRPAPIRSWWVME